jgi:hypothetical protein
LNLNKVLTSFNNRRGFRNLIPYMMFAQGGKLNSPEGGNIDAGVACGNAVARSNAGCPIPRVGMKSSFPD